MDSIELFLYCFIFGSMATVMVVGGILAFIEWRKAERAKKRRRERIRINCTVKMAMLEMTK